MKKTTLILGIVLGSLLMASVGGGAAWWLMRTAQPAAPQAEKPDTREYRYVSLEKIIVMLRSDAGKPLSHYLALDLVFKVPVEHDRTVKQHLPLLRSIAVQSMSALTYEQAGRMTVDEFASTINAAYDHSYASEGGGKPFAGVMIGKLIIE
jgi:flagellar FliL protein